MEKDNILLLKNGNTAAFERLYKTYYVVLCKQAMTITRSSELAEEIVDDLFFYLWHHREELQVESLQAYLFCSVRNNSERVRRSRGFREEKLTHSMDDSMFNVHHSLSDSSHPLGWLLEEEMENVTQKAIDGLPKECRQVFELSRNEGKKYIEIAAELGISVNTVKYHIKKALRILSSKLLVY